MMAVLASKGCAIVCMLTVTPQMVPALTARAARYGVLDRFVFMGNIPNKDAIALMRCSLAHIMPSKLESFGLPYFEAMGLGCPVVAADRDFAREACGNAALYADANDGEKFADHVLSLFENVQYREEMSHRALHRFEEVHRPWSQVAMDYLAILENLAK